MREYLNEIGKTIEESISNLDVRQMDQMVSSVVDVLRQGHKVVITGLGKNEPICQKFVSLYQPSVSSTFRRMSPWGRRL